ncbi:MAG: hypothetical protein ACP5I6_02705 [Caldisphaera sp.]
MEKDVEIDKVKDYIPKWLLKVSIQSPIIENYLYPEGLDFHRASWYFISTLILIPLFLSPMPSMGLTPLDDIGSFIEPISTSHCSSAS